MFGRNSAKSLYRLARYITNGSPQIYLERRGNKVLLRISKTGEELRATCSRRVQVDYFAMSKEEAEKTTEYDSREMQQLKSIVDKVNGEYFAVVQASLTLSQKEAERLFLFVASSFNYKTTQKYR